MVSVKTLCQRSVGALMTSYGFSRYSNSNACFLESYYRQVNDVIQILCFMKKKQKFSFSFEIYPLSMGIHHLDVEEYDLTVKRDKWSDWMLSNRRDDCWRRKSARCQWWLKDELIATNFDEPIRLIKEYVIPIFDNGCDSKSAYKQLTAYERTIYTGLPEGMIMHNWSFVLLCLQAGDYENAENHMAAICKKSRKDMCEICKEQLYMIQNHNVEYWDKVLEEGTKKTQDFLESIKPKSRTKK